MLPKQFKQYFWWSNFKELDVKKDKALIVKQLLNYGHKNDTDWVFKRYGRKAVKESFKKTYAGDWSKSSLGFWELVFNERLKDRKNIINEASLRNFR